VSPSNPQLVYILLIPTPNLVLDFFQALLVIPVVWVDWRLLWLLQLVKIKVQANFSRNHRLADNSPGSYRPLDQHLFSMKTEKISAARGYETILPFLQG
jgi:hypothetical protein